MNNGNNQKIPCGGFYLGDGLAMDGDTLKSLGGAYVKVVEDEESPGNYKIADDSPLNYETAMKYDGLVFMQIRRYDKIQKILPLSTRLTGALDFDYYAVSDLLMTHVVVEVREDNSVHIIADAYTLTPAT